MRRIIASVDVGSDKIKFLVAEIIKDKTHVLFANSIDSNGIKNGLIVNENAVVELLKSGFNNIEDSLGVKVEKALVNVNEVGCEFLLSEGISTITNPDKIITGNDIVRCLQASVYNRIPSNMEVVSIIPVDFIINDEEVVKNPKNIVADKLKVKTVLTMTLKKNIYDVIKCFDKVGVEVTDILFGIMADYYTFHNESYDKEIGALINIGSDNTTVGIFNKGILTNCEVISMGGSNIDNDIAFIYKITKEQAKNLKETICLAHPRLADTNISDKIVNKLDEEVKITQFEISEIAESRLTEILNLAKKQINLLTKKEISYIIVTGGLTEIGDFSLLIEEALGKSTVIGQVKEIGIRDNKYSTALGMIKYFDEKLKLRDKKYSVLNAESEKELSEVTKRVNVSNDSIIGKIFGYFFDN